MTLLLFSLALAAPLEATPGRSESRVYSAPYALVAGRTLDQMHLVERLERLGYERVRERPTESGTYFLGRDRVWIYRRAFRRDGLAFDATLLGIRVEGGRALGALTPEGIARGFSFEDRLEPELMATSLDEVRARPEPVVLADLPEHAWRPLLALEDHRFFDHIGVDGIAIARALVENARGGQVSQGGSTLTQQLIKNRDLTPKRTLDRKASEALRALALEAEYSKEEILQAYLNTVYYGHVDGVAIYGLGAASRTYFSKAAEDLTLAEAAALAAVLQGPNGLHPLRHPEACVDRRNRALARMLELGWASEDTIRAAQDRPLGTRKRAPTPESGALLAPAVARLAAAEAPKRADRELGLVIETAIDPIAQAEAEGALAHRLGDFRGVQGAVVLLSASTGEVRAYVGGNPRNPDGFDRAGRAERQPGSTAKPFALFEAVERCGTSGPLHLQTWVSDRPVTISTDKGAWKPDNYDRRDHGPTRLRDALVHSYNRPFARIGARCGAENIGERMRLAGLDIPASPPQSVVLGTVETTPLALAGAYSAFLDGRAQRPSLVTRIEKPAGAVLYRDRRDATRVGSATGARLVHSAMADVVARGTATRAASPSVTVVGKTGSTQADAWFAGLADDLVLTVWLGRDDAGSLGITGGAGAAPVAKTLAPLALAYPAPDRSPPLLLVTREIDPETGLRVGALGSGEPELFRRGVVPPVKPMLGRGSPEVLE